MNNGLMRQIGNTPLVKLKKVNDTKSTILAKLEALKPANPKVNIIAVEPARPSLPRSPTEGKDI